MEKSNKEKLKAKIKQLELLSTKSFIPEATRKELKKKLKDLRSQYKSN